MSEVICPGNGPMRRLYHPQDSSLLLNVYCSTCGKHPFDLLMSEAKCSVCGQPVDVHVVDTGRLPYHHEAFHRSHNEPCGCENAAIVFVEDPR